MWKPDICVYHGGCDDGFGAAWVVRRAFDDVVFVEGRYGGFEWPADLHDKNILFVDFSLKRDQMIALANGGLTGQIPRSVVVLDHHKTAEAELADWNIGPVNEDSYDNVEFNIESAFCNGLPVVAHFDMNHSGAVMAWQFFNPDVDVHMLLKYVEDRDLWRFKLSNTRAVSAALRTYPQEFDKWDFLSENLSNLIEEGSAILRGHEKNVQTMIQNRYWTDIAGHRVPVVNVPYHYASDCADAILKVEPDAKFCAAWFRRGDGKIQYSLRSTNDRMDVSEIAKKYGGGGHRNAAGYERLAD